MHKIILPATKPRRHVTAYNRAYIAPRPSRKDFPTLAAYIAARDEWVRDYPNLYSEEMEFAHLLMMRLLNPEIYFPLALPAPAQ